MNTMTPDGTRPQIMIVDDEPENLHVLDRMLTQEGYSIAAFLNGGAALAAAHECPPFIALLDVRMPGMDGYTLCARMKEDPAIESAPVLFISAFGDRESRLAGFAAGGVDYIAKPICEAEVLARVNAHAQLRHHREKLEDLVALRTRDLTEANRRLRIWDGCKADWLNVLAHELRTPLTGVLGVTEVLFAHTQGDPEMEDLQCLYDQSRARIDKLIEDAALLSAVQVADREFLSAATDVGPILRRAAGEVALSTGMTIRHETANTSMPVFCDESLLGRALRDLIFTAAQCVKMAESVRITSAVTLNSVAVFIETDGRSLDGQALETFFVIGGQKTLLSPGGDWGLGPPVAQRILSLFHGCAFVQNREPSGIQIHVELPLAGGRGSGPGRGAVGA